MDRAFKKRGEGCRQRVEGVRVNLGYVARAPLTRSIRKVLDN